MKITFIVIVLLSIKLIAQPCETNGYPYNTADIIWTDTGGPEGLYCPPYPDGAAKFGTGGGANPIITDIVTAFNNSRTAENEQTLSAGQVTMPLMTLADLGGSDAVWNSNSDPQKALILMNLERVARGIDPFQGVDANVQSVAQSYAEYLLANNEFDHNMGCGGADPCNPGVRMNLNAVINGHKQFTCRSENLFAFYWPTWDPSCAADLTIERAVRGWIYNDLPSNGHRNACLFNGFNDDFSTTGAEGFIGLGVATGAPYGGTDPINDNGQIIVFNFFDPDASYNPALPLQLSTFLEGSYNITNGNMDDNLSGNIPLTSPYTEDQKTVKIIPANVADWVLVELRDKTNSPNVLTSKSAFILKNGNIVETDGISPLMFPGIGDNYFVSVKHRNHLGIMSEATLPLSSN